MPGTFPQGKEIENLKSLCLKVRLFEEPVGSILMSEPTFPLHLVEPKCQKVVGGMEMGW